jgi:hypothetical protein
VASLLVGPLLRHVAETTATIWVETDAPCTVEVLGHTEPTFKACGHHYALVRVEGLQAGQEVAFQVRLDGELVWPLPDSDHPPSTIRTLNPGGGLRLGFGSCRFAALPAAAGGDPRGTDALGVYARRLIGVPASQWPDLFAMLGDQVYADETTPSTRARLLRRRGEREPRGEVADFEEYTWLYQESWTEPDVRWLLSTVPTVMIFDDHDVHDDWNASRAWRSDAERTPWWRERVTGALMSYWVYQHLGNLSPDELDADPTYRAVRESAGTGRDVEPLLRDLAVTADREADGAKGYRWSFWRDLGRTRLVVLDSRCGRLLDGDRSMISKSEFAWAAERMRGELDHVLVGTSLPWLLPPVVHDIEVWDERLCEHRRPSFARVGEALRRAGDLEHWSAFRASFEELAKLLLAVASTQVGTTTPASVCVLSGDVHHSYICEARFREARPVAPVYQLTCSPLHNHVPVLMRLAFRLAWSRPAERAVRWLLTRVAHIPRSSFDWDRVDGPMFGNAVGTLQIEGRRIEVTVEMVDGSGASEPPSLRRITSRELSREQTPDR